MLSASKLIFAHLQSERPLGLLYEERLEAAERRRLAGNALFKEGKAAEAASRYLSALSYLDEDFLFQLEGHYLDQAHAVKVGRFKLWEICNRVMRFYGEHLFLLSYLEEALSL